MSAVQHESGVAGLIRGIGELGVEVSSDGIEIMMT